MKTLDLLFVICIVLMITAIPAFTQIINNSAVGSVESLPQNVMDAIGNQRWLFNHASVGGNIIEGMRTLHSSNPGKFKLAVSSVGFDSSNGYASAPSGGTMAGNIYECDRGNPGWEEKFNIFERSVQNGGWQASAVDVCMDKLCFIDQNADANTYISKMSALESLYPDTKFVYTTIPITTSTDNDNMLRNQYNQKVREYCSANNKLLFDIADIEAHDLNGNECTFNGNMQCMFSGYSDDGGHLNQAGQQRVALGWYAVAASLASNGAVNTQPLNQPVNPSSPM